MDCLPAIVRVRESIISSCEMNTLQVWHQELSCLQVSLFVINEHSNVWALLWTAHFWAAVFEVLIFASTPGKILCRRPQGFPLPPLLLPKPQILKKFQFRCLVCATLFESLSSCSVASEHNFVEEITNSCHAQLFQGDLVTKTIAHQDCVHRRIEVVQIDHELTHIFEHLVGPLCST